MPTPLRRFGFGRGAEVAQRVFDLRVERSAQGGNLNVVARPPSGGSVSVRLDLADVLRWDEDIKRIQDTLLLGRRRRLAGPEVDAMAQVPDAKGRSEMIRAFGTELYRFLFPDDLNAALKDSVAAALRDQVSLRLRLHIGAGAADIAYLPWEALWDPQASQPLSTMARTPMTRAAEPTDSDLDLGSDGPLSILFVVPRALSVGAVQLDRLKTAEEQAGIRNALKDLRDRVKIGKVDPADLLSLRRWLNKPPPGCTRWDVVHFIGHGGFDDNEGQGFVVMDSLDCLTGEMVTADVLTNALEQVRLPGLVVLNSCSGAEGKPGRIFSSTAEHLVRAGIPAVVAMQFEITDDGAQAFSQLFYPFLADGRSVQDAITQTRGLMKDLRLSEWITPVLYMSTREGWTPGRPRSGRL